MASLNRVQIIGNLGKDPEVRQAGESVVASFNVATTDHWVDKAGDKQEKTEWHRIEVWGRQADFVADYVKKGAQVFVEGALATDKYTDKEGVERYSTKIKAFAVQLLGRRESRTAEPEQN